MAGWKEGWVGWTQKQKGLQVISSANVHGDETSSLTQYHNYPKRLRLLSLTLLSYFTDEKTETY